MHARILIAGALALGLGCHLYHGDDTSEPPVGTTTPTSGRPVVDGGPVGVGTADASVVATGGPVVGSTNPTPMPVGGYGGNGGAGGMGGAGGAGGSSGGGSSGQACDLVRQDCSPAQGCYVIGGRAICQLESGGGLGATCTPETATCARGFMCVAGSNASPTCRPICDRTAADPCRQSGGGNCTPIGVSMNAGYCAP
jgi:hypothetical protein